jgi:hypothetical protein
MNITETTISHRCGARTKFGPCENIPVDGKRRCFQHGCAPGAGAPFGNKNAIKHGMYSASAVAERQSLKTYLKEMRDMVKGFSSFE